MNKYFAIFLFFSLFGFSQSSYNNFSIELSSGYTIAAKPYLSSYGSGFYDFNNIILRVDICFLKSLELN